MYLCVEGIGFCLFLRSTIWNFAYSLVFFFFRLISLQLLLIRQEIINRIIITHVKRTQVKQVLFKKVDTNRQMDIITHIQIHATFSERVCDCYVTLAIS